MYIKAEIAENKLFNNTFHLFSVKKITIRVALRLKQNNGRMDEITPSIKPFTELQQFKVGEEGES